MRREPLLFLGDLDPSRSSSRLSLDTDDLLLLHLDTFGAGLACSYFWLPLIS
jgi:hypothetical protein